MPILPTPERVTVENGDWWVCVCGNEADQDRFPPCDLTGDEVEPTEAAWPEPLYVCGRIIEQGAGEVGGRRRGPAVVE